MSQIRKGLAVGALGAAAAVAIGAPASAHSTDDNDVIDADVQHLLVDVDDTGQVVTNDNDSYYHAERSESRHGYGHGHRYAVDDNDVVDLDVQYIAVILEDILQIGVND